LKIFSTKTKKKQGCPVPPVLLNNIVWELSKKIQEKVPFTITQKTFKSHIQWCTSVIPELWRLN
jgi:hypothetical protein